MQKIALSDFLARTQAKRDERGIEFTSEYVEALRNKGLRRTPEKRAALREIEARCTAADIEARPAYY